MSKKFLGDREKALEEAFFAKENARLLERLHAEESTQEARRSLSEISGLTDEAVLRKLTELGVQPETWAAVAIAPLVEVAWADGKVEDSERRAVLSGAEANGVARDTASYELLEAWLNRRPDGRLLEVWGAFIVDLCAELGDAEIEALKSQILGRARSVAEAAGGFLGLGGKVSPEEEVVLAELGKAFQR
jgi:hypothetical protein